MYDIDKKIRKIKRFLVILYKAGFWVVVIITIKLADNL